MDYENMLVCTKIGYELILFLNIDIKALHCKISVSVDAAFHTIRLN